MTARNRRRPSAPGFGRPPPPVATVEWVVRAAAAFLVATSYGFQTRTLKLEGEGNVAPLPFDLCMPKVVAGDVGRLRFEVAKEGIPYSLLGSRSTLDCEVAVFEGRLHAGWQFVAIEPDRSGCQNDRLLGVASSVSRRAPADDRDMSHLVGIFLRGYQTGCLLDIVGVTLRGPQGPPNYWHEAFKP